MEIQLAYGKTGLARHTDPNRNVDVVKPHFLSHNKTHMTL